MQPFYLLSNSFHFLLPAYLSLVSRLRSCFPLSGCSLLRSTHSLLLTARSTMHAAWCVRAHVCMSCLNVMRILDSFACMCVSVCLHLHASVRASVCACVRVCRCVCVGIRMCTFACLCSCLDSCLCLCLRQDPGSGSHDPEPWIHKLTLIGTSPTLIGTNRTH